MNSQVKGTKIIDSFQSQFYEQCRSFFANSIFLKKYNFEFIYPTTLNFPETFKNLGEFSDIISKEMFIFKDKKERLIALSPEHTAPISKYYIKKKKSINVIYFDKCFRYQKPQHNVKREFIQLGLEWINIKKQSKNYINIFIEIFNNFILFIYKKYNIKNPPKILIKYNYLNDKYKQNIKAYITNINSNLLCNLCKKRQQHNFIRILDCNKCKKHIKIKNLQNKKDNLLINSNLFKQQYDFSLVRGLDYYNGFIFEINILNIKKSFCSGGFYTINKKNNFGFAMGIYRFYNYIKNLMKKNEIF